MFSRVLPTFLSRPPLVVGTPVLLANLLLTAVMPSNLLREKENPNIEIDLKLSYKDTYNYKSNLNGYLDFFQY